ncbi:SMP-30/gluconolactonase/LRE family protein [Zobellia nedashkovskayae]|uniref:SMP-30/gluconolactonase/LRE family protein n=1 Tax=Zobellia nedashkovskayae TaxID=2779510 RepID=UPI00188A79FA|nr:SMP-30/gluconolactonase/LRE family protein [Zobellia nedashkovskayae]
MLNIKSLFFFLALIWLNSCSGQKTELIALPFEQDLFPEGITIDSRTKTVYLNSLKHNKIVSSSIDGSNPKTFLESNEYNYLSGFGMTIKGDTLYALGNTLPEDKNSSILLFLQLSTGDLIDSYTLNDSDFHYWNDLAVSSTNEIFITDSESNKIYKIKRPDKSIAVFLDNKAIPNCNGITISPNDKHLYLASNNGIAIVDLSSKKLMNKPKEEYSSIDGLKYYKNNLYGIVNGWGEQSQNGLFKYELNSTGTEILKSKKLVEFTERFRIPTTFDICDGYIYFITNTQIDNLDGNTNKIIDTNKLEPYRMMKIKVE